MESHYDKDAARAALDLVSNKRSHAIEGHLGSEPRGLSSYAAASYDGMKTYRLTKDETDDEATFYMDGVVVKADFAPFKSQGEEKPGRPLFAQQSVKITGLGGETFDVAVDSINDMWIKFKRVIAEGTLRDWTTSVRHDMECIDFTNRLFEKKSVNVVEVAFENGADDEGELKDWGGKDGFVHTDDNKVVYLKEKGEGDASRVVPALPTEFKPGDIVEVLFSPIVVPAGVVDKRNRGPRQKTMRLKLRSILLLNSEFSDQSTRTRLSQASSVTVQPKVAQATLKRKIKQYKNMDAQKQPKQAKVVGYAAGLPANAGSTSYSFGTVQAPTVDTSSPNAMQIDH